jgi:hypothetical protein
LNEQPPEVVDAFSLAGVEHNRDITMVSLLEDVEAMVYR